MRHRSRRRLRAGQRPLSGRPGGAAFFYGTLLDPDLRRAVLERTVRRQACEPAHIDDHRAVYVAGAWYPTLLPQAGARTDGLLVRDLDGDDLRRLIDYEGDAFVLVERDIVGRRRGRCRAGVFVARPGIAVTTVPWTLAGWRRRHKRLRAMKGGWPD